MRNNIVNISVLLISLLISLQSFAQKELPKDAIRNAFLDINYIRSNPEMAASLRIEIVATKKLRNLSQSQSLRQYCGKIILEAKKHGPYEIPEEKIESIIRKVQQSEGCRFVEFIIYEQQGPLNGKRAVREIIEKAFWADALLARNDVSINFRKIGFALYSAKTKGNYYWVIALTDKTRYNN